MSIIYSYMLDSIFLALVFPSDIFAFMLPSIFTPRLDLPSSIVSGS